MSLPWLLKLYCGHATQLYKDCNKPMNQPVFYELSLKFRCSRLMCLPFNLPQTSEVPVWKENAWFSREMSLGLSIRG